ncbi:hypothetical protein HMPREF0591_1374 [Mycobacterium parascrofulaceum ATCC BAA-614]|uniref:Uncharacterized protein n=1 Tax=Mycobacterium parascrofulaceum ATCC BAA-614 TaxID=525368 RepID=D5P5D0_9MYCO|nr:hypothetical protein HMPREF0591_1374 [Mycobacterium parascrofulaceum ATCC BAA-614]
MYNLLTVGRAVMAIDVIVAQRIQSTVRQPGYLKAWIRDS